MADTYTKELLQWYRTNKDLSLFANRSVLQYHVAITLIENLEISGLVFNGTTFVYSLKSRFTFGKHKGNELRCVYKIQPDYVVWCMLNADGFIIEDATLNVLSNESVFNHDDLEKYLSESGGELKVDLSGFEIKSNQMPFNKEIREKKFVFPENSIAQNRIKSQLDANLFRIQDGSKWDFSGVALTDKIYTRKSKIKILPPTSSIR